MITKILIEVKNQNASIKSAQGRATTKAKARAEELGLPYIGIMGYVGYIEIQSRRYYKFSYELK